MSPEQQRIAIAEWCGVDGDYLNDLNAMHEAEERLSPDQRDLFANSIIHPTHGPHWRFNCVHAAAAQRAEALLKTIGRWSDNKVENE